MATASSSPASRVSPLALSPLALARQRDEQGRLRRVTDRTFTSLELGRRKWDKLSERGKLALTNFVNSRAKLGYAHGPHWGPLSRCTELRHCVAISALRERHEAESELQCVINELDAVVTDMRAAAETLGAAATGAVQQDGTSSVGDDIHRLGAP